MSPILRGFVPLLVLLSAAACSSKKSPVVDPVTPAWLEQMPVVPLEVVEYRAVEAEGEHALFMRVSRFPDRLTQAELESPPQVVLRMDGPATGEDLPEERIVIPDKLIQAVRVSRTSGTLTVVIEVAGATLPPWRLQEAADWIILRLKPPQPEIPRASDVDL